MLANIYMNRFLKYWRQTGRDAGYRAHVISYADDFVILSRGHAEEALAWTKAVMTRLGLTLNEAKTSVRDARQERFDFLGYTFGPHITDERPMVPGSKSVEEERATGQRQGWWDPGPRQSGTVAGSTRPAEQLAARLARLLHHGTRQNAYRAVDHHVYHSVRRFLVRRHKVPSHGTRRFPLEAVYGELGVLRLRRFTLARRRVP